jgi:hypothetical protein
MLVAIHVFALEFLPERKVGLIVYKGRRPIKLDTSDHSRQGDS